MKKNNEGFSLKVIYYSCPIENIFLHFAWAKKKQFINITEKHCVKRVKALNFHSAAVSPPQAVKLMKRE